MDDVHIITVATHSECYFPYLIESCKRNGKELTVLGYGEKWQGFTWRFELMINYLKTLNTTDIVCFIDGYDVICTRNLSEIKNEFIKIKNEKKCKLIIGHDKILNYLNYFVVTLYFGKCNNIHLNAGTYIGYVEDLLNVLLSVYDGNNALDDQQILIKYCNLNKNNIYIDTENKLFLTIAKPFSNIDKYLDIQNNKIVYNNNTPFFLHAPGHTYLENTLKLLGYDVPINNINQNMYNRTLTKLYISIKNNIGIFFIILIICLFILYFKKIIIMYNINI